MSRYVIGVDQSTQGTKALLFDQTGAPVCRTDLPHAQLVNEMGWVSHDGEEIYRNTVQAIRTLVGKSGIDKADVVGLGISNQRETSLIWDRDTGYPLAHAVVWQCTRATALCEREPLASHGADVFRKTGMRLSPYFPAAKLAWLLEHTPAARERRICMGTVDCYLVYRLTGGRSYKTDCSNASRTQLFNIFDLKWDEELCAWFGIDPTLLPEVVDSDSSFGETDCEGFFDRPIPIHAVLGDSHAALFGQNCRGVGMTKATYGTGSSIMMNIGTQPVLSRHGVVTSLAWGIGGRVEYVLEGNLNYTGAVITWLKDDLELIRDPGETQRLAEEANREDGLYLVPAFTGLGAPYWNSHARAAIVGMDRTTRRRELVRAGLECVAYQITDVLLAMEEDSRLPVEGLRVDGGPTRNRYLMQFQSDILGTEVFVPDREELSGIGAAYLAGLALGVWDERVFERNGGTVYTPHMSGDRRRKKYAGWQKAVHSVLNCAEDTVK